MVVAARSARTTTRRRATACRPRTISSRHYSLQAPDCSLAHVRGKLLCESLLWLWLTLFCPPSRRRVPCRVRRLADAGGQHRPQLRHPASSNDVVCSFRFLKQANARSAAVTHSTMRETMRVKAAVQSQAPVLMYEWARYMEGALGGMLSTQDLAQATLIPALHGADGLVWWGGPDCINSSTFWRYTNTTLGPLLRSLPQTADGMAAARACGMEQCHGNGWCVGGACQCFAGFGGAGCAPLP